MFRHCPPRWSLLGVNIVDHFWEGVMSFAIHEEWTEMRELGTGEVTGEEGARTLACALDSVPRSPTSTLASSLWSLPFSDQGLPLLLVGRPLLLRRL